MGDRDILFAVRNNFYLGSYQAVINEASDLEGLSDAEELEKEVFVYRAYIALGSYEFVIGEIKENSPMALQAVKLLAQYSGAKIGKDVATSTLSEWLADPACNRNAYVLLIAGLIYASEGNYVEALKCCHSGLTLDMMAACVQVYLKMDRVDKAEQQLKAMQAADEDATITQLATAWVGIQQGGAKVQDAVYIYQELGDKYNWTVLMHNGLAVCHMKMGQWEDAERDLLDALNKNGKDADTLANLITCGLHLGKNTARYTSQLKLAAPEHPCTKRTEAGEELFDRAAASLA